MSAVPLTEIRHRLLTERNISLRLLRDDLNHPLVGGNKWRKLKYNIAAAKESLTKGVVSMGGVYSNHLYALAAICAEESLPCLALVRENETPNNPTLDFIRNCGAEIRFINRTTFRLYRTDIDAFQSDFPDHYVIPEGGSNELALKGCEEMSAFIPAECDVMGIPVGTGCTMAGLINVVPERTELVGFPALKEQHLEEVIASMVKDNRTNWRLERGYHLGGIGAYNDEFLDFLNRFHRDYAIRLDPIYTGKMLFGFFEMISNNTFEEGSNIVAVITGGQQGIEGFNFRFGHLLDY